MKSSGALSANWINTETEIEVPPPPLIMSKN